ncbi:hypothetical protein GCM10009853_093580 [Glycomyces scopariae]
MRARGRPDALLKGATASPSWDQASATSMPRGTAAEAARPWTMPRSVVEPYEFRWNL